MISDSCFLYYNIYLKEISMRSAACEKCNTNACGRDGGMWSLPSYAEAPLCDKVGAYRIAPTFHKAGLPFSFPWWSASSVCLGYKPLQFLTGETVKICNPVCHLTPFGSFLFFSLRKINRQAASGKLIPLNQPITIREPIPYHRQEGAAL